MKTQFSGLFRALETIEPAARTAHLDVSTSVVAAQDAGLRVGLTVVEPAPVVVAVARTAYRVVRESITNAARHAPGSAVEIVLRFSGDGWGRADRREPALRRATGRIRGGGGLPTTVAVD